MPEALTDSEKAQLEQTIDMFQVITDSQPNDYQSLEILKEAYYKLGRADDVLDTAKKIAKAYENSGQLTAAILEWESISTSNPHDSDAKDALNRLEFGGISDDTADEQESAVVTTKRVSAVEETEDGRTMMEKIFVDGSIITMPDFNNAWPMPDAFPPGHVVTPFVQNLADQNLVTVEQALGLICDRAKLPYLPLNKYDFDLEAARQFPKDSAKRWCCLPIDRMSKMVLVATCNPFNKVALAELERSIRGRVQLYISPPEELLKSITAIYK